jgi:hypothetical protein
LRETKDVYRALEWAAGAVTGSRGRNAVVVFTDGRDDRLSPRWLMEGEDRGIMAVLRRSVGRVEVPVLDPLFGLPDSGELTEYRESVDAVARSGVRFFFLAVDTARPPVFSGNVLSGLFPGSAQAAADYIGRVRSRLERWAAASRGAVIYRTFEEGIPQYAQLYRALGMGIRYTIALPEAVGAGRPEGIEVRTRVPDLQVVRLPQSLVSELDR